MIKDKTERSRKSYASGVRHFAKRISLLALAGVLVAGCSSHKPTPLVVAQNQCLDAGPVGTVAYETCVKEQENKKAKALAALLYGPFPERMVTSDDGRFQESDFPDTPLIATFKVVDSLSATEKRALPFKARITWKYISKKVVPVERDRERMTEMEKLILPALEDKGLAKWICTVTGGQQREWIFYTQSEEAFIAKTRAILLQTGPYPIELSAKREPESSAQSLTETIRMTPKKCVE
ncbi:DUF695 domain-containing protein [Pseudomonas sp. UV AK001]|uniref:DUF695 domain-containing protein n=1 Tax=Pseudomonas sp. UV AK001 TaxID=3384791 RepID=UPI0038D49742